MTSEPWRAEPLPAETVAAVRAELGRLVDMIITAVRAESPVYGEVLAAPEGIGIRLGIEQAIRAFLDAVESGGRPAGETDELWRRLGEAEFQAGRSLDDLRAAFRTGTRAAWRGAAELASRAGVSAAIAIALAETIFIYGDELATDVVEGYLRMQSDQAGERERRQRRVALALLDPDGTDPDAVARAAELARWPVPRTLAVVALEADSPLDVTRRLDADVLAGADSGGAWLIVPDPDGPGRAAALTRALEGEVATLGPTVAPPRAHLSLRWARSALALVGEGAFASAAPAAASPAPFSSAPFSTAPAALSAPAGPLRVSDHLATVILLQDRDLAAELTRTRLAALDELPAAERTRLLDTLAAWLEHQRHTPAIAAQLHIHPQTVRYRMAKLRELLEDSLETPDGRFELVLALRIRSAYSGTGGG